VAAESRSASVEEFRGSKFLEVVKLPAVPHVEANTIMIQAGAVSFGVEYRSLTEDIMTAFYGEDVAKRAMAGRFGAPDLESSSTPIDSGVSVHVFDAATGEERLRFDDLDQAGRHPAHYHYIGPDGRHALGWFDPVAEGPFMPWTLERLRTNLVSMLEFVGAGDLAAAVEPEAVDRALVEVEAAVKASKAGALTS
jgi:hypothetical protein